LKAVVFDWAGTTVDHGSRAPAIVFLEIFRQRGVPISAAQARGPMGMAKRDHLAAIAALPEVARAWATLHGRPVSDADIDAMYVDFLPLQRETLHHHCDVIAGVPEAVARCREAGLKIGSSTGYTRELMEIVTTSAAHQGYQPDCVLCAEDVPQGRPAPYLLYAAALNLQVYPLSTMVVVDDTPVGIAAGRNAGCWTVGVTRTGNSLGLSAEEAAALPKVELNQRCAAAARELTAAGAHFTIESAADIMEVLREIEACSRSGMRG
jgi:phosphonoacetaldehyde hydrolase